MARGGGLEGAFRFEREVGDANMAGGGGRCERSSSESIAIIETSSMSAKSSMVFVQVDVVLRAESGGRENSLRGETGP
jgi:hypothetical protein